jgi:hypothetical protein
MHGRGLLLALLIATLLSPSAFGQGTPEIEVVGPSIRLKQPVPLIHTDSGAGIIAPTSWGGRSLRQCSRKTLGPGDSYWTPTLDDARRTDRAILGYFRLTPPPSELKRWPDLGGLYRQYLGVVRGGHRTVYVSFLPVPADRSDEWRHAPMQICDGGPSYFGAEVDPESLRLLQIDFDSCMCREVSSNYRLERP